MTAPAEDDSTFVLLHSYLEALHCGQAPDKGILLAHHPELADLLECLEALDQLAPPAGAEDPDATLLYGEETPAVGSAPAMLQRQFGKYVLEAELGRGGMGVVYRARQTDLDRPVALKMILAHFLTSADHLRRFEDESRAAAGISHPHVIAVYDVGQIEGQPYFAMQYVAGRSLAELLRQGPLEPEAAARIVLCVAQAVAHLHAHGIVHRDLKPSNILLGEDGHPFVTDFGLAKILAGDSHHTSTGVIVGTPSYMSPEQAAGHSAEVGPPSDVYSLGVLLYEALTGRPPFHEETPLDTLVQVLEGEPVPPRQLRAEVPADLELICLRCLEKAPEDRFASADALAGALDAYLKGEDVGVRPPGLSARLRRWARREPALASRAAMLLACMLIAQVYYQLFQPNTLQLHLEVQSLLGAWIACSFVCQRLLDRPRWAEFTRYLWVSLDVGLFSLLAFRAEYFDTPVMITYPLLVAASGLWFRTTLVWCTAGLCVVSYTLLLVESTARQGALTQANLHVIFLIGVILMAVVTAYQVERVRALSRYYEHRPLP